MNVEQVALDNGTTISFGVDEHGDTDFSILEIQTGHELVTVRPTITLDYFGYPVVRLEISDLHELSDDDDDDDDDDLDGEFCTGCSLCASDIFEDLIIG